jgi:16S rRNA (adenine1518-N6/adenine1519-N6)-dimethyltransferase
MLRAAGVDPQARGEVLGIGDFAKIAEQRRPAAAGAAEADAVR